MGGRSSKPQPKVCQAYFGNMLFKEGCMGITDDAYIDEEMLLSAPCLVIPLRAISFVHLMVVVRRCIEAIGNNDFAKFAKENASTIRMVEQFEKSQQKASSQSSSTSTTNQDTNTTLLKIANESGDTPFDPVENYRKRLFDLLEILNLMHLASIYEKEYQYVPPKLDPDMDPLFVPPKLKGSLVNPVPQLPALAPPKKLPSFDKKKAEDFKFLGPIYLFVANHNKPKVCTIEAYLYFPTMTKDIRPAPNYDFIGKSHRWMHRVVNDEYYDMSTQGGCKNICMGAPQQKQKLKGEDYFIACGCVSEDTQKKCPETNYKRKKPGPPIKNYFVIYRVNMSHVMFKRFFSPDSPDTLLLNILPSNWDLFPGCKYTLRSRNEMVFTRLESYDIPVPGTTSGRTQLVVPGGRFGVFINGGEDLNDLCKKRKKPAKATLAMSIDHVGKPRRMVFEGGYLTIYASEDPKSSKEDVAWTVQAAQENAAAPLALVLLDDGRIDVFDRDNKSVVDTKFVSFIQDKTGNLAKTLPPELQPLEDESDEYDPEKDFQARLENLKEYLRARKLLIEEVAQVIALNSQTAVQEIGPIGELLEYDDSIDYKQRLTQLVEFLRNNGHPYVEIPADEPAEIQHSVPNSQPSLDNVDFGKMLDFKTEEDFKERLGKLVAFLNINGYPNVTVPTDTGSTKKEKESVSSIDVGQLLGFNASEDLNTRLQQLAAVIGSN
jgi:hypothetical protein